MPGKTRRANIVDCLQIDDKVKKRIERIRFFYRRWKNDLGRLPRKKTEDGKTNYVWISGMIYGMLNNRADKFLLRKNKEQ